MSGYPSPNVGAQIEFAIELSGTGIVAGAGSGEYSLTPEPLGATYQDSYVITATVVDQFGTPLNSPPVLTAVSYNGPATESGEASENTQATLPPNSAGQQYANAPNAYNPLIKDVIGIGQTSDVASVTATAPFTVTITGVGQALIEFRTPRGTTARLNVQGIQQS
jgi:hypothetical protein